MFGEFEPDRSASLVLLDHGASADVVAKGHVIDAQAGQVTSRELTANRHVEHGKTLQAR
jgi:hypothetical protein